MRRPHMVPTKVSPMVVECMVVQTMAAAETYGNHAGQKEHLVKILVHILENRRLCLFMRIAHRKISFI